jgi:hypothetical protein
VNGSPLSNTIHQEFFGIRKRFGYGLLGGAAGMLLAQLLDTVGIPASGTRTMFGVFGLGLALHYER